MKISSHLNSRNINNSDKSFKAKPVTPIYIPETVAEMGRKINDYIKIPENKLIMAMAALAFHPAMDLMFAEEDKKTDSAIKSASKAIAGGITGVTIRGILLWFMNHFVGFDKKNKVNNFLLPNSAKEMRRITPGRALKGVEEFNNTFSSLVAVAIMVGFTNKNIDVPVTNDLQDFIGGIVKENKKAMKSFTDVYTARKSKIDNWLNKHKNNILDKINPARKKSITFLQNLDKREDNNKSWIRRKS